jgi:hypothetical protein
VLVRYDSDHDPMLEWVYNGADIDNQKIVWARDMGPAENQELLDYYNTRRAWLLEADKIPLTIRDYSIPPAQLSLKAERAAATQGLRGKFAANNR